MDTSSDLRALEQDVEASRRRFAEDLDRLTSPETAEHAKKQALGYAQDIKDEALQYLTKTKDEVVDSARHTVQDRAAALASDLKERAAANPLGVALIGAGLAWRLYKHPPITTMLVGAGVALLMSGGGARRADPRAYRDPYDRARPRGYVPGGVAGYGYPAEPGSGPGVMDRVGEAASAATDRATETASQAAEAARDLGTRAYGAAAAAAESVAETASRTGEAARDLGTRAYGAAAAAAENVAATAGSVSRQAAEAVHDLREAATRRASEASTVASRSASDAMRATSEAVDDIGAVLDQARRNPVVIGLAAFGAAALLARAIKETEAGQRLYDETRRRARRTARDSVRAVRSTARYAADQAGELASTVAETGSKAARGASDLAGSLRPRWSEERSELESDRGRAQRARTGQSGSGAPRSGSGASHGRSTAAPYERWFRDEVLGMGERYPLLLGALALATGAAAGSLTRLSDAERRTLGPAGREAKKLALEAAEAQYEHLREAAVQLTGDLKSRLSAEEAEGALRNAGAAEATPPRGPAPRQEDKRADIPSPAIVHGVGSGA